MKRSRTYSLCAYYSLNDKKVLNFQSHFFTLICIPDIDNIVYETKMTELNRHQRQVICITLLLCLLSFLLLVKVLYEYKSSNTNEIILDKAKEDSRQKAEFAIKKIEEELNSTSLLAEGVTKDLSFGKLKNDSMIQERLMAEMKNNPDVFSIVVAYSPGTHAGKLYAPHFKRHGLDIVSAPLTYDYTMDNEKTAWYNDALRKGSKVWISPYFGIADGNYQIDSSVPFYLKEFEDGDKVAGVVSVSHSLEGVRVKVGDLNLGKRGYGFIVSGKGVIISYPIQEYLGKNINELAKKDQNLHFLIENMAETEHSVTNSLTGQSYWIFHKNIPSTDWILGFVLPQEETLLNKKIDQNHSIIHIVFATFAFIFFLSLLLVSIYRYDHKGLWVLAVIFSLLCILGIGFIWHFTINNSSLDGRNGDLVVFDREDVETVLQHTGTSLKTFRISTGVFLQSIEFLTANDVLITGYVWQNVSGPDAKKSSPGFSFPDSKETTIEKAYANSDNGIVGWHFKTTLRQKFEYSRYPFDREDLWIRLWSSNSTESVIVPNFDSYKSLIPENLPGLEPSILLGGWKPQKTFFSYRVNPYTTNFGLGNFSNSNVPEFYFNVDFKRDFKTPFESDLLPVIVVVILLFAILTIITKTESITHFGFSSHGVLTYCTSLFFTLILAHSSLRNKIPIDSTIYLEYFYFIVYLAILAVSLNSIAFASNRHFPFIDVKDNLYVKVLYWPVITGILLLITFLNFY